MLRRRIDPRLAWLLPAAALVLACGCSAQQPCQPEPEVASLNHGALLPPLPAGPAQPRQVSATAYYALQEADIHSSQGVSYDEFMGWEFSDEGASWVILALDTQSQTPLRLDVEGFCYELWAAVADYTAGNWRFLHGNAWSCGPLIELPTDAVNPEGVLYVLLYTPLRNPLEHTGYGGHASALRVQYSDGAGDTQPPQWPGGNPNLQIETSEFGANVNWQAAIDPAGIAAYVLYFVPWELGVDPSSPYVWLPPDFTEIFLDFPPVGYKHSVALRAIDAKGNISAPLTPADFSMPNDPLTMQILRRIEPGDQIRLSWSNPGQDHALTVIAPNGDEGSPQAPEDAGRSFSAGPDSLLSGLAEEWVKLRTAPPAGEYVLSLSARFDNDSTFATLRAEVYDNRGKLRWHIGDYAMGGALAVEQDIARLYIEWPEQ